MDQPIVEVAQGLLKGKADIDHSGGTYYSFQGIPYAKPPLGKLRFRAPEPPEAWTGVRDATEEGDECFSRHIFLQNIVGSEDCLFLNVYTPELPSENCKNPELKPVMVWIHGGAFLTGSSKSEMYGPDFLIPHDVVIVTLNYRLGLLGFLSIDDPKLGVPGNAGLKDIVMGLRWIQKNIAQFMGDPNNVTLFGESAGAAAVHYLILSTLTKGLFHKAIVQSGCALNCWAVGYSCVGALTEYLGLEANNYQETLDKLQEVPVESILTAQENMDHNFYAFKLRPVCPVIEKYVDEFSIITQNPADIILSGNYNQVPLIIGYTSREGMLMEVVQPDKENLEVTTDFETTIPHTYHVPYGSNISQLMATEIKNFYYQDTEPTSKDMEKFHILVTDCFFLEAIFRTAKLHVQSSPQPVYFYRLSLETSLNFFKNMAQIRGPGCCHGDDLGYLFKMTVSPEIEKGSVEDIAIKNITALWTNFARSGNPNSEELLSINWHPMTQSTNHFLDIGESLTTHVDPEKERMEFWEKLQSLAMVKHKL